MILFAENGKVTINSFESLEKYRAWEAEAGDEPMRIAYAMKVPETAAGDALVSLCGVGCYDDDGFEVLLEKLFGEAFQAGINLAQRK